MGEERKLFASVCSTGSCHSLRPQSMHLHPWSEQGHLPLATSKPCFHAHSNSVVGVAVAFSAIKALDQD